MRSTVRTVASMTTRKGIFSGLGWPFFYREGKNPLLWRQT